MDFSSMHRRARGVEGDPLSGNCRSGQVEHPLPSPLAMCTPNPHSITRRGGDDLAGVVEHPPYGGSGTGTSSPSSGSKASTAPSNHTYDDRRDGRLHLRGAPQGPSRPRLVARRHRYLPCFLPPDNEGHLMSVEAKVCTASSSSSWTWPRSRPTSATIRYGSLRIRYIMLTTLHTKQQLRVSLNWEFVWQAAAKIINKLVHMTPELKCTVIILSGSLKPHNRSHQKKQQQCCRHTEASVLLDRYVFRKRGGCIFQDALTSHMMKTTR
ncbi:hypothetical protein PVAP13_7KG046500 [Panicum virgatum]|uniref:Uncharacterized protein n=1 Tax=Panicum virgatum TaxID=38727 RepID=A0A8T0QCX2_PANVG|nr:hypothetical protein PVAP13_7KG046500 [Panicum virgatum]